jgi:hypothetical protein
MAKVKWPSESPAGVSKSSKETRNRRDVLNIKKALYVKPIANIILNGEKLKLFPLKPRRRQACTTLTTLIQNVK